MADGVVAVGCGRPRRHLDAAARAFGCARVTPVMSAAAPADYAALRASVLDRVSTLSPHFRQVARHLLDEPNDFAFETLTRVAERCGVQASTIVRFAQQFGFDGAAPMQRMLREALLRQETPIGYAERLRQFSRSLPATRMEGPAQLLGEFVGGSVHALEHLRETLSEEELTAATDMIDAADTVFMVGLRRAFPVAAYFAYLLAQAGKRLMLVDGIGGMATLQLGAMTARDLLVAISFHPYAPETVSLVEAAAGRGAPLLAISDSAISPIGRDAALLLQVRETEVRGFRSIAASMALVQTLAIQHALSRADTAT